MPKRRYNESKTQYLRFIQYLNNALNERRRAEHELITALNSFSDSVSNSQNSENLNETEPNLSSNDVRMSQPDKNQPSQNFLDLNFDEMSLHKVLCLNGKGYDIPNRFSIEDYKDSKEGNKTLLNLFSTIHLIVFIFLIVKNQDFM